MKLSKIVSYVFFLLVMSFNSPASVAQTAKENFTAENANEVVATYDAGGGQSFRAVFKFTGTVNGKNQWLATWKFNGMNHASKYVEKSHDAWSIYLVSADRATPGDTAQIDFFKRQVLEKTADGNFSGKINSFKTN